MKKIFFLLFVSSALIGKAQFSASNLSAGISGNYLSFFKSKFSTVGAKVDLGYQYSEKLTAILSYTYSSPIKSASSYYFGGTSSYTIPTEISTKISTVSLGVQYFLKANPEGLSVYLPVGASFIFGGSTGKATGPSVPAGNSLPAGYTEKEKFSSYMMFGGIGAMYAIGPVKLFADGGVAIPANNVNGAYVEVNVDTHLFANVGVRIPFGIPDSE